MPTPALDRPDFPFTNLQNFKALLQKNYLFKGTECVLLPEDRVEVLEKSSDHIRRVRVAWYPSPVYIDIRMTKPATEETLYRMPLLPSKEEILAFLKSAVGTPYVWGGNYKDGIPEMLKFYPPRQNFDHPLVEIMWTYRGVDCTGLLFQATNGCTPRNSGDLANSGTIVPTQGKSIEEIVPLLQPLDIVVWKGHVFIYLGDEEVIESRWPSVEDFNNPNAKKGVVITPVRERFEELFATRRPIDDPLKLDNSTFVVVRWYP